MHAVEMTNVSREYVISKGTPLYNIPVIIAHLTGKIPTVRKVRRGLEKITGLVGWHKPGRKNGHLTVVMDGIVYDTDGNTWPIERYRIAYKYVARICYTIE